MPTACDSDASSALVRSASGRPYQFLAQLKHVIYTASTVFTSGTIRNNLRSDAQSPLTFSQVFFHLSSHASVIQHAPGALDQLGIVDVFERHLLDINIELLGLHTCDKGLARYVSAGRRSTPATRAAEPLGSGIPPKAALRHRARYADRNRWRGTAAGNCRCDRRHLRCGVLPGRQARYRASTPPATARVMSSLTRPPARTDTASCQRHEVAALGESVTSSPSGLSIIVSSMLMQNDLPTPRAPFTNRNPRIAVGCFGRFEPTHQLRTPEQGMKGLPRGDRVGIRLVDLGEKFAPLLLLRLCRSRQIEADLRPIQPKTRILDGERRSLGPCCKRVASFAADDLSDRFQLNGPILDGLNPAVAELTATFVQSDDFAFVSDARAARHPLDRVHQVNDAMAVIQEPVDSVSVEFGGRATRKADHEAGARDLGLGRIDDRNSARCRRTGAPGATARNLNSSGRQAP